MAAERTENNKGDDRDDKRTLISPDIAQALIAQGLTAYLQEHFIIDGSLSVPVRPQPALQISDLEPEAVAPNTPDFYVRKEEDSRLVTVSHRKLVRTVPFETVISRDIIDFFAEQPNVPHVIGTLYDTLPYKKRRISETFATVRERLERAHGHRSIFKHRGSGVSSSHELPARVIFGKYQG